MPLDPNIALNVQPPQIEDPLTAVARAAQVKNALVQSQIGSVEAAQAQQQLADDRTMRQVLAQNNGDFTQALPQLAGKISAKSYLGLQQNWIKMQQDKYGLLKTQNDVSDQFHETLGKLALGVKAAGNTPQAFQSAVTSLVNLNPQLADHLAPYVQRAQQDPTSIAGMMDGLIAGTKVGQQATTAQAAQTRAAATEKQATTAAAKNTREQFEQNKQNAAAFLAGAANQDDYAAKKAQVAAKTPDVAAVFPDQFDRDAVLKAAMKPEQIKATEQQAAQLTEQIKRDAETQRHNISDEAARRLANSIAGGRLAMERTVNNLKYGPGTVEYWTQQLQENPDSIKEMPPELRSSVGKSFKATTGLPLPSPLNQQGQVQETAARNALDGINFVRQALQNPEIRQRIGPILGRLGNAEQAVGTATGLSPQAAQLAQELRTRMRYLVLQEGRSVLGGRLPQQIMSQFESNSPSVTMDPNFLTGALNGAEANARSIMENADKQRFGGKARPPAMRGLAPSPQTTQAAPPLPASLSQADIGKTYTGRDGRRIKITAVNPQNPTQFRGDFQ